MKKLLACFVTSIVLSGVFQGTAMAEELLKLTVKEAASIAINSNIELLNLSEDKEQNQTDYDNAKNNLIFSSTETEYLNYATTMLQSSLSSASYTKDEKLKKEQIELSITEYFSNIIAAEKSLKLYDDQLELDKQELNIALVKKNLGLMSDTEYNSIKNAYDQSMLNRNSRSNRDLDNRYDLELDLSYKELGAVSLSGTIKQATDNSNKLQSLRDSVTMLTYNYEHPLSTTSNEDKEIIETNINQTYRSINDTKASIEQQLTSYYNDIVSMESDYETYLIQLDELKESLKLQEKLFELCKATQISVDKLKLQIGTL